MSEKYFIASNSADGFCSYYASAFESSKFSSIYVIKGGPGTGKSFFMKEVARRAEERGMSVRYIYCSSDPDSLDAIIIPEMALAILDGTHPHIYEPRLVGTVESILDFGAFLNTDMLKKSRKTIEIITSQKQRGFERLYRYLAAYRELCENVYSLVKPCVKIEKIRNYVKRFTQNMESGTGREENLLVRAIGMKGFSSLDTYFQNATVYYAINDYFDTAHIMMDEIHKAFGKMDVDMRISNNPIIKNNIDALCATANGLTFEISNTDTDSARVINMKRFLDLDHIASIRHEYRTLLHAREEIMALALAELENIKKYHFILEEIYGSAMDFEAKEEHLNNFCNKIFENN